MGSFIAIVVLTFWFHASVAQELQGIKHEFNTIQDYLDYSSPPPPADPGRVTYGEACKILLDGRNRDKPVVYYFDLKIHPRHSILGERLKLPDYWDHTYEDADPRWYWACDWQGYVDVDGSFIYGMQFNPNDEVAEDDLLFFLKVVKATLHWDYKKHRIAFVQTGPTQTYKTVEKQIRAMDYEILSTNELFSKATPYQPMHAGEAWGYLRIFPKDQTSLTAKDITFFESVPLALSVVGGVITAAVQTVNSHVNLKSKERGTPNMVLINHKAYPCIEQFRDKPVHLIVSSMGWALEPTTADVIDAKYAEKLKTKSWVSLYHTPMRRSVRGFHELCPPNKPEECVEAKKTVGTKAANLGFLINPNVLGRKSDKGSLSEKFGYDLTPPGFGIPFQHYVDFIQHHENKELYSKIEELADKERKGQVTPEQRETMAANIRKLFYAGVIPETTFALVKEAIQLHFTSKKIYDLKFRSSSNAEDLPGFDGAGLYDSFSAQSDLILGRPCSYNEKKDAMEPKTVECAIKGVYGSLWNKRAIEERSFAKFRQESAVMGIAVTPKYKNMGKVTGNSVVITQLMGGSMDRLGYTVSAQAGTNDVTNPEPGTQSETSVALFKADGMSASFGSWDWKISQHAIVAKGSPEVKGLVVNKKLMDGMMETVLKAEEAYCIYKYKLTPAQCKRMPFYRMKSALDFEFKFIDGNRIHCKQIREFGGQEKFVDLDPRIKFPCSWRDPSDFRPNGELLTNVAINKPTSQSSTSYGGLKEKANDGIIVGYVTMCCRTLPGVGEFWEVDLLQSYLVKYIRIFNRADPDTQEEFRKFTVRLFREDNTYHDIQVNDPTGQMVYTLNTKTVIDRIRKVRLIQGNDDPLTVAEVEVYTDPPVKPEKTTFPVEARPDTKECVWDKWQEWTKCAAGADKTCGVSTRTRTGANCFGYDWRRSVERKSCHPESCPPVNGDVDDEKQDLTKGEKKVTKNPPPQGKKTVKNKVEKKDTKDTKDTKATKDVKEKTAKKEKEVHLRDEVDEGKDEDAKTIHNPKTGDELSNEEATNDLLVDEQGGGLPLLPIILVSIAVFIGVMVCIIGFCSKSPGASKSFSKRSTDYY